MKSPLVSIIVPVFNVEPYLDVFISSVKSQTFQNFEVIMVDDGSQDKSRNIIQETAEKDSRFKLIAQENQGTGIARNKAVENSNGEFLLFLDPDDSISIDLIEENVNALINSSSDIVVFGYDIFTDGKLVNVRYFPEKIGIDSDDIDNFTSYYQCGVFDTLWNKMIRASIVRENSIKSPNWTVAQDRGLLLEIIKYKPKIIFNTQQKAYYHYNFRRQGSTVSAFNSNSSYSIAKSIDIICDTLRGWKSEPSYKLIFLMVVNDLYFDAGIYNVLKSKNNGSKAFIKDLNNMKELRMLDGVSIGDWLKILKFKEFIKLFIVKMRLAYVTIFFLRFVNEKR